MITYNLHQEKGTQFCRLDSLPQVKVEWQNEGLNIGAEELCHLFYFPELKIHAKITYNPRRKTLVEIEDSNNKQEVINYLEISMGGRLIAA